MTERPRDDLPPLPVERDPRLVQSREATVPAGFADRVMEQVEALPPHQTPWWHRSWVLAGAWAAASLLLLVRIVALFAVVVSR